MCDKSYLEIVRNRVGLIHRLSQREFWDFQKMTVKVWGKLLFPSSGYTLNLGYLSAKVHDVASRVTVLFLFTASRKPSFNLGWCLGNNDKQKPSQYRQTQNAFVKTDSYVFSHQLSCYQVVGDFQQGVVFTNEYVTHFCQFCKPDSGFVNAEKCSCWFSVTTMCCVSTDAF